MFRRLGQGQQAEKVKTIQNKLKVYCKDLKLFGIMDVSRRNDNVKCLETCQPCGL